MFLWALLSWLRLKCVTKWFHLFLVVFHVKAATAGILGLIGPRRSRRRFEESYYSSSDETDSEHSEQESVSDQQVVPAGANLGLLSQKRPSTEYLKPTSNVNHKGNSKVGLYGSSSQNPSRPISVQRKIDWYLKHGESDVESDDEICVCMGKCASRQCPCRKRSKSCSAMCLCNMRQCQNLDNRYGRATPIELPNWIPNGRVKRHDDVPVVPTTVGRTPWQFSPPQDTREGQGQSSNEVSPVHDEGREDGGPGTAIYSRESDKRGGLGFDGVVGRDLSSEMIQSESKNETKPTLSSEANTADKVTCYCHSKCLTFRCQCNKAGKYCENCSCSDSFCQNRRLVERPDDFYEVRLGPVTHLDRDKMAAILQTFLN